ncbi:prepilin-type N-terminal cleavage/methylation domain-containing protein [Campylobacter gastrosuis]|uniref:Prepilin-type N-terminal cleavage/methylation domain-containing protein n=1 Tax=Campylobacter gastrosuis TaxID=2974576 RepID=A0ABT7HRX4_9BACT|nr:prepilin-type N-terminal cleavage/methylation domain-containing protein [Campylobacter gastrosuis]MDL0089168.1 prepilin-type N-terminal cleavage/methylation domain-containing protein [Campylobacter gastrosuis]
MKKRGFSLLEVIISVIIIAITSLSVPMIMSATANANKSNVIQEAAQNTKALLNTILKSSYSCEYNSKPENKFKPTPRYAGSIIDPNFVFLQNCTPNKNNPSRTCTDIKLYKYQNQPCNPDDPNNGCLRLGAPKDFYTIYNLDNSDRRIMTPNERIIRGLNSGTYKHNNLQNCGTASSLERYAPCLTTGAKDIREYGTRNTDSVIKVQNSGKKIRLSSSGLADRDFAINAETEIAINGESNPFNDRELPRNNYCSVEAMSIQAKTYLNDFKENNRPREIKIIAIISNIGDSPALQTKVLN